MTNHDHSTGKYETGLETNSQSLDLQSDLLPAALQSPVYKNVITSMLDKLSLSAGVICL